MPDSVPNYITIDPVTGEVTAEFSGRVVANGLDLANPTGRAGTLRWPDLGNADPDQIGAGHISMGIVEAFPTPDQFYDWINITATDLWNARINIDDPMADLQLRAIHGPIPNSDIVATCSTAPGNSKTKTILRGDGSSDYVLKSDPGKAQLVALPRVGAPTIRGGASVTIANWYWTCPTSGIWTPIISGSAWVSAAGQNYVEVLAGTDTGFVTSGYLDAYFQSANWHVPMASKLGTESTFGHNTAGVQYEVRARSYIAPYGSTLCTDPSDVWQGALLLVKAD